MSNEDNQLAALGWRFDVDADAGELHLEHAASGTHYVLDAAGGLRVPGDAAAAGDVAELQKTLASALDASTDDREAVPDGGQSTGRCTIECDETTGEVTIESDTKISMQAPTIDVSASGNTTIDTNGVLTLQGALIKLN